MSRPASASWVLFVCLFAVGVGPCRDDGGVEDIGQTPEYAQTAWPSIHRDARGSDFAPFVAPLDHREKWTALAGAALLTGPSIGPEGNLYASTGQGPGTSHLHAFDRDGHLLWQSEPQEDIDDLDSAAVGSAPAIDVDGDLYVGDENQLWAFHADGRVKWVSPLPHEGQPLVSALLLREGLVVGVTSGGTVGTFMNYPG